MLLALILAAAPPPPAAPLESLSAPVDGYDLQSPFQVWSWWVESQKGAATEAVLAQPDAVEGHVAGEPLIRFEKYNDFGHYLTGEIRPYCLRPAAGSESYGNCHYRLRRAYVAHGAGNSDGNPVARWMRENFDSVRLVAHFRALGLPPSTDWWMTDRARIFSPLPSAVPTLVENATVVRLDSQECPALGAAIAAIETRRLGWAVDLPTVQPDRRVDAPAPHAIRAYYTLRTLARHGAVTIRASGGTLRDLVAPVLDSADECERRRSNVPATG